MKKCCTFAEKKDMRYWCLYLCCLLCFTAKAQLLDSAALSSQVLYLSMEEAKKADPSQVYRLRLKRKLPADFESEIRKFSHLQELQLVGMHLKEVPPVVCELTSLTRLDLSNNKLEHLPADIKNLTNLEYLILNRNYLFGLPSEIQYLEHLVYLDLWSNLIVELPQEITALESTLKEVDLRVINMNDERKIAMQALLPRTRFYFSPSCNCSMR